MTATTERRLRLGRYRLALNKTRVMGIVNVTPDSFSDGGRYFSARAAIAHAESLVAQGADILDIGGESTRPGATPVDLQEERRRLLPVLRALIADAGVPISVDTRQPAMMREALDLGVDMINDVAGLRSAEARQALADYPDAAICLMHMQGEPQTMQRQPAYQDVVGEVRRFFAQRLAVCAQAGVNPERVVLDPGLGFGKLLHHNVGLIHGLHRLAELGPPVLVGISRKRMIGELLGDSASDRTGGSVAAGLYAARQGARILRVHDVRQTRDALRVWQGLEAASAV